MGKLPSIAVGDPGQDATSIGARSEFDLGDSWELFSNLVPILPGIGADGVKVNLLETELVGGWLLLGGWISCVKHA